MSSRVIARGTWFAGRTDRRRRDQRPVAPAELVERLVGLLPAELRRALADRRGRAAGDLRRRPRVDVIDDAPPRVAMRFVVHAGAAGADARIRRDAGHLGEHEPRAAVRAAPEVHEVVVVGQAVHARVLRHRRHDDAVRKRHAAQRERGEHRRNRRGRRRGARANQASSARRSRGRAAAGSRAKSAGCGSAGCRRTARRRARVALDVLEPLGGVARAFCSFSTSTLRSASYAASARADVAASPSSARGQRDRVLDRELRARADREVRRVRGIADQHDRNVAPPRVPVRPRAQITRGKRIQIAEPRRCAALLISRWPPR